MLKKRKGSTASRMHLENVQSRIRFDIDLDSEGIRFALLPPPAPQIQIEQEKSWRRQVLLPVRSIRAVVDFRLVGNRRGNKNAEATWVLFQAAPGSRCRGTGSIPIWPTRACPRRPGRSSLGARTFGTSANVRRPSKAQACSALRRSCAKLAHRTAATIETKSAAKPTKPTITLRFRRNRLGCRNGRRDDVDIGLLD